VELFGLRGPHSEETSTDLKLHFTAVCVFYELLFFFSEALVIHVRK